jgi:hypothetical protein
VGKKGGKTGVILVGICFTGGLRNLACKAGCQCFHWAQVLGVEINVLTTVFNVMFMRSVTKELRRQDVTR